VSVLKSSLTVMAALTAGLSLASPFAAGTPVTAAKAHTQPNAASSTLSLSVTAFGKTAELSAQAPRRIAITVTALDLSKLQLSDFGDAEAQR
jgi:hypothetical protein